MALGNSTHYAAARAAKLGITRLPATLERLRGSISEHYLITVLHIVYDRIDIGPHAQRPCLTLIVDTAADYAAVHKDLFTLKRNVKDTIKRRFARFARADSEQYETENLDVVCYDFSYAAMGRAANQFRDVHADEVVQSFSDANVWAITGLDKYSTVFYLTDADIAANQRNGTSQAIAKRCFQLTQAYDEFGYFALADFPLSFDSKQRFDTEFQGSWFYYFR